MSGEAHRVNVTLDPMHAAKLRALAERTHLNEGTLARSLLASALDEADPDAGNVTELLDAIPGRSNSRNSAVSRRTPSSASLRVARVVVTPAARDDLARLIQTHSLPADTVPRVARSLRPLAEFPLLGAALEGRWEGFRFVLGPWRWTIVVYVVDDARDEVAIVATQDARSARSPTTTS